MLTFGLDIYFDDVEIETLPAALEPLREKIMAFCRERFIYLNGHFHVICLPVDAGLVLSLYRCEVTEILCL